MKDRRSFKYFLIPEGLMELVKLTAKFYRSDDLMDAIRRI